MGRQCHSVKVINSAELRKKRKKKRVLSSLGFVSITIRISYMLWLEFVTASTPSQESAPGCQLNF